MKPNRRFWIVLLASALAYVSTPAQKVPAIPTGMGYCVTVVDAEGRMIGVTHVPFHKPDPAKLDEFIASVRNAITLIGRTTNRQDIIDAAATIELIDNPIPPLVQPRPTRQKPTAAVSPNDTGTCTMVCTCGTPIYATPASAQTDAGARKAPHPPGGVIIGCGGPCTTCEHCVLTCKGPL